MKRRHLADVLLKILGLSMCLYNIPIFFNLFLALAPAWHTAGSPSSTSHQTINIREFIEIGIGIVVIVMSRKIAEFWFKNDDE
jgi:hypothetical protein